MCARVLCLSPRLSVPFPARPLHSGDEGTQIRCRRHWLTRCAWGPCWQRQAHGDFGEAPLLLDILATADDAVGKRDTRLAAHNLAHLELVSALMTHSSTPQRPRPLYSGAVSFFVCCVEQRPGFHLTLQSLYVAPDRTSCRFSGGCLLERHSYGGVNAAKIVRDKFELRVDRLLIFPPSAAPIMQSLEMLRLPVWNGA